MAGKFQPKRNGIRSNRSAGLDEAGCERVLDRIMREFADVLCQIHDFELVCGSSRTCRCTKCGERLAVNHAHWYKEGLKDARREAAAAIATGISTTTV